MMSHFLARKENHNLKKIQLEVGRSGNTQRKPTIKKKKCYAGIRQQHTLKLLRMG
jgi:hypothetical protein